GPFLKLADRLVFHPVPPFHNYLAILSSLRQVYPLPRRMSRGRGQEAHFFGREKGARPGRLGGRLTCPPSFSESPWWSGPSPRHTRRRTFSCRKPEPCRRGSMPAAPRQSGPGSRSP